MTLTTLESRFLGTIESSLPEHWMSALESHFRSPIWMNSHSNSNFPIDVRLAGQRWIEGWEEFGENCAPICGLLRKRADERSNRYCE